MKKIKFLTKENFDKIKPGLVFATGVLPNSHDGLYMNSSGGELRWVAKKGQADDWAVYCYKGTSFNNLRWPLPSYVAAHGDKVHNDDNIRKCVPCDDEVLKAYRP